MAVTRLMCHFLPAMRARGRGGVMNLASLVAFAPGPWQAPYFASKAYVLSLTAAVSSECFGEGVRICAVACGPFESRSHGFLLWSQEKVNSDRITQFVLSEGGREITGGVTPRTSIATTLRLALAIS